MVIVLSVGDRSALGGVGGVLQDSCGNKWRSDAIWGKQVESFSKPSVKTGGALTPVWGKQVWSFKKTSECFQRFRGLETELVEEVRVPSGVARSWAWCSPARTFSGSKQRPRAVDTRSGCTASPQIHEVTDLPHTCYGMLHEACSSSLRVLYTT